MKDLGELPRAVEAADAGVVGVSTRRGRASGFVLEGGAIVTVGRVIARASHVRVSTGSGTFDARVVGVDPDLDLAVLRAVGEGSTGSSPVSFPIDPPVVGTATLALARRGQSIAASFRVIGAVNDDRLRTPRGGEVARMIEMDRGVPRGFAGGPLIDASGRVIGMTGAALVEGADLVVPHDTVVAAVLSLEAHGSVARGRLGVAVQHVQLPSAVAASLGQQGAALVIGLAPDGPAMKAGLTLGDAIVSIDDVRVERTRDVLSALRGRAGTQVRVGVVRVGALTSFEVVPSEGCSS